MLGPKSEALAQKMLKKAHGDPKSATALLHAKLASNTALKDEIIKEFLEDLSTEVWNMCIMSGSQVTSEAGKKVRGKLFEVFPPQ